MGAGYSINEDHSLAKTAVGTPGYTGETLERRVTLLGSSTSNVMWLLLACRLLGRLSPHGLVLTPSHDLAAPEVLLNRTRYDGKQADVWSSGVMLYAMVRNA